MHEFAEHVAAVKCPRTAGAVPIPCTPSCTSAGTSTRSPGSWCSRHAPFVGAADASHGFAEHVAAVSVPALQDDVPDTVYPELHVGWHVDPLARELVQSPAPPFVGAADASHGSRSTSPASGSGCTG